MALWIFKEPFVPVKRCLHVFFLGSSLQIVLDTHAHKNKTEFILIMVSAIDSAKRVLVALLKSIAAVYSLTLSLTRESTEAEIRSAFRKVSKKAHPDHGGKKEHQAALNTARDTWEDATKAGKGKHGGERRDGPLLPTQARRQNDAGFRFQSLGVLLTYQKFADTGPWDAFLEFVRGHLDIGVCGTGAPRWRQTPMGHAISI